jgi:hypothetical protein
VTEKAGWAQIVRLCMQPLRRGSWYRVVDVSQPGTVTVEVFGAPFVVDRDCVSLHDARPEAWSVVHEDGPSSYYGGVYGVCPQCLARQRLDGNESELTCPSCHRTYPVDWSQAV